ncbi:MAG: LacI family DNA-binding transcriptional regulator [Fibrella sp.]|nr:LacI family DNA-binding transcriptional regulator [Armatimonadota bacterium]
MKRETTSNMLDVAKRAGVSRTTVSYVLNGRRDVAIPQATRDRVLQFAREVRYSPNIAARALAKGKTNVIGLWLFPMRLSIHLDVVQAVRELLVDSGLELVICQMSSLDRERAGETVLVQWPVDGVLAFDGGEHVQAVMESRGGGTQHPPIVSFGPFATAENDFSETDTLTVDFTPGIAIALRHLHDQGANRIAYVTTHYFARASDNRYAGYYQAMTDLSKMPEVIALEWSRRPDVREEFGAWLDSGNTLPDALFCFSDDIAIGVHRALRDRGVRVGSDVLLVGCDGIDEGEYIDPPLATVAQPVVAMCRRAWERLQERLSDHVSCEGPPRTETIAATFVVRASALKTVPD